MLELIRSSKSSLALVSTRELVRVIAQSVAAEEIQRFAEHPEAYTRAAEIDSFDAAAELDRRLHRYTLRDRMSARVRRAKSSVIAVFHSARETVRNEIAEIGARTLTAVGRKASKKGRSPDDN